jgi:hydrogenase maturation protein HypF
VTVTAAHAPVVGGERLRVRGLVQGVGLRPAVWRLARAEGLTGQVFNDGAGVVVELWGGGGARRRFRRRMTAEAPPLARIESVAVEPLDPAQPPDAFRIAPSRGGAVTTGVVPDAPVCPACLGELFDPGDRRYRYPFLNCTHCGPRFTITGAVPYDRPHTAMAGFPMCPACRAEYDDPGDRRFHAQPTACPDCGPRLVYRQAGQACGTGDPVAAALASLRAGRVVAIKGIGGYHLAVDARNPEAVARLRARKNRGGKPFAVMAANTASLAPWAGLDAAAAGQLEEPARPIVLLPKTVRAETELAGLAPGLGEVGAMLPYAPVHYLLFHEAAGRPDGTDWLALPQDLLLVMTSANPGSEPLVTDSGEAAERLAGIADAFLEHDRPILVGCDDSVLRPRADGRPAYLRRARGRVPAPLPLAEDGPAVLALGAWLNNAPCLVRGREAFPGQHVGDLANPATVRALMAVVDHLLEVLRVVPAAVAHDRHPDFPSTRLAQELAEARGIPAIAVQHHHAHIAAVAAEHGLTDPVLGLALDGVGLGDDGGIWGGELLAVAGADCRRLGRLRPLPLPGGDRAATEPWRMGAAALHVLGRQAEIPRRFGHRSAAGAVAAMLAKAVNSPETSSAGRLFDAAAALLGLREESGFEGQAAMELEARAADHGPAAPVSGGYGRDGGDLDLRPLLEALADECDPARGAARFHATLAAAVADWAVAAAGQGGLRRVALSGGCWVNRLLADGVRGRLEAAGLSVFEAHAVPPGDGGLALGQAWVARQQLRG